MPDKWLVVDGNNIAMRSISAMLYSGLSAGDTPTGALLSFINTLAMHVRHEQPTHMVVCWDGPGRRWREDIDPGYKANRNPMPESDEEFKHSSMGLIREFLSLANVGQMQIPHVEADDLVSAYWWLRDGDDLMVILSNDKDFLQLLDVEVEQVRVSSGGAPTDRWTMARVVEDMGVWPQSLAKVMALNGDVSDNVIGVRGIGPKKAIKALREAEWDLDAITVPSIVEALPRVKANLDLVDLRKQRDWIVVGPPPEFRPTSPESPLHEMLVDFLLRYQMQGVLSRYNDHELWGWRDLLSLKGSH